MIVLGGELDDDDLARVKDFVINTVDSREASMELPAIPRPAVSGPARRGIDRRLHQSSTKRSWSRCAANSAWP